MFGLRNSVRTLGNAIRDITVVARGIAITARAGNHANRVLIRSRVTKPLSRPYSTIPKSVWSTIKEEYSKVLDSKLAKSIGIAVAAAGGVASYFGIQDHNRSTKKETIAALPNVIDYQPNEIDHIDRSATRNLIENIELNKNMVKKVVICGDSASGKTELANEYAKYFLSTLGTEEKRTIIVFHAEDQTIFESDYFSFADNIDVDTRGKTIGEIRTLVNEKLKDRSNYLFIFDNVQKFNEIEGYIPPSDTRGTIIITTILDPEQEKYYKDFQVFNLSDSRNRFTITEAIKLFDKTWKGNDILLREKISLLHEFGFSPLLIKKSAIYLMLQPEPEKKEALTKLMALTKQNAVLEVDRAIFAKLSNQAKDLIEQLIYLAPDRIKETTIKRFENNVSILRELIACGFVQEIAGELYKIHRSLKHSIIEIEDKELKQHAKVIMHLSNYARKADLINKREENEDMIPTIESLARMDLEKFNKIDKAREITIAVAYMLDAAALYYLTKYGYLQANKLLEKAQELLDNKKLLGSGLYDQVSKVVADVKNKQALEISPYVTNQEVSEVIAAKARILYSYGRILTYYQGGEKTIIEAREDLEKAQKLARSLKRQPLEVILTDTLGLNMLAYYSQDLKRIKGAITRYEEILEDKNPYIDRDGETEIVIKGDYKAALKCLPRVALGYLYLGKFISLEDIKNDNYKKALIALNNTAKYIPDDIRKDIREDTKMIMNTLAEILLSKPKDFDNWQHYLKDLSLKLNKRGIEALDKMNTKDNIDQAEMLYKQVIDNWGKNPPNYYLTEAQYGLARIYFARGKLNNAQRWVEESIANQKEMKRIEEHRDFKKTRELYGRILRLDILSRKEAAAILL